MKLGRLISILKLAGFRSAQETPLDQPVPEGELGGALLQAISGRGIAVTPNIRNSIDALVSAISLDAAVKPYESEQVSSGQLASACGTKRADRRARGLIAEETAVIMFTDIVSSTALVEKLGDSRARQVFRAHNQIIRRHVAACQGTEVKIMGDGFMLTFQDVRQALRCAIGAQKDLQDYSREHPDVTLSVRMGMSIGTPIREEDDLFGKPVILAARLSAHAEGGQVLICQRVHALASQAPEFSFVELGPVELKGFSGLHTLYEVAWRKP